jgi:hypothetical protein
MMKILQMPALATASLFLVAGARSPDDVDLAPLSTGDYRDQVQGSVDGLLSSYGQPDSHMRTRTAVWVDGGARVTCTVEHEGSSLLMRETWSESQDGSSYYPPQWRIRSMGNIQVGMRAESVRAHLEEDGSSLIERSSGLPVVEEWLLSSTSYQLTFAEDGTLTAYEVERPIPDWEHGVSRCSWLQVLGERFSDQEVEEWSWAGRLEKLTRSGDYLEKAWTTHLEPL